MSPDNVHPFKKPGKNSGKPDKPKLRPGFGGYGPSWQSRILCAVIYLVFGGMMYSSPNMPFELFLVAGILYWVFVQRRRTSYSFFSRFHMLTAIFAFLLLGLMGGFTIQCIKLLLSGTNLVSHFFPPALMAGDGIGEVAALILVAWKFLILGTAATLAISCLLGRMPTLPVVNDAVHRIA